jgi:hypothetical protein
MNNKVKFNISEKKSPSILPGFKADSINLASYTNDKRTRDI